ncbi:F-box/LRR-repeat protein [Actinidia chinensis var. chinensis]|uniref:F-box/LRR-repeat protein n=1 Tax=Actinidia chinensis var. chinensis TaxID=1590841 RepID=A0A2R6R8S3_ACTCC|nr:F-box/LRR-repeat protein [Actinidia chinensis var. chinensis]
MEGGKWEDLTMDVLVNVLERVGIESLLLSIPFVCKSWYKATLRSECWRRLDFSEISFNFHFVLRVMDTYHIHNLHATRFVKSVVKRSNRSATLLTIPSWGTEEALLYVARESPDVRSLVLPYDLSCDHMIKIPNLISNWKNLETVQIGSCFQMQEVLAQISNNCKNFFALTITKASIGSTEASAIVNLVPNIRYLDLRHAWMDRSFVVTILEGCKKLEYFDIRHCTGFREGDLEILNLAANVRKFKYEGSRLFYRYQDCGCSYR